MNVLIVDVEDLGLQEVRDRARIISKAVEYRFDCCELVLARVASIISVKEDPATHLSCTGWKDDARECCSSSTKGYIEKIYLQTDL